MGKRLIVALCFGGLMAGCQMKPPTDEEVAELEQVKKDRAALMASFGQVETKLVVNVGLISADAELRQRHNQVSQVACQSLSEHWSGINRFLDNQKEKEVKKRHTRVASADHLQAE